MSLASDFVNACQTGLIPAAEQIVYTAIGKAAVTIWAVVDRSPPKRDSEAYSTSTLITLMVNIANDPVLGVSSVDTGGDTVTLPLKLGGPAKTVKVRWPESHDQGLWFLRCG